MSIFRKKSFWIIFALLIALVLASYCILYIQMEKSLDVSVFAETDSTDVDPMLQFRTARQQLRSMQKAQLNSVAHGSNADEELRAMAQRQLLRLCEREEQELTLEGLLQLQGWENAIVTVSDDIVNVLVCAEMITQHESSAILEMVCRETGILSGNVKIIPIN